MSKVEILAPAGSMESLIAAIKGGANAIYLAGKSLELVLPQVTLQMKN